MSTTPASTPAPIGRGREFSVVATGDLLSHTSVVRQAQEHAGGAGYDFAPMFQALRPMLEAADLAICHLETPVAPPGTEPDSVYPDFAVPAEVAAGLASVGYDRCSLASNHALDRGAAGVDATLNAFEAAGLGHAGMARTPEEAAPRIFEVNGVTVAHLSFTFSFNGFSVAGEPWRSNRIDVERIIADASSARTQGAEFVIVSMHWGAEGITEVTPEQRDVAEQITASGAIDLIVGHHAHVVQPIEQINGRWVVFGLGNILSGMGASTECCGVRARDGLMVRIDIVEQPDGMFAVAPPRAIPTYVARPPFLVVPVEAALADPALAGPAGDDELQASLERTRAVVGAYVGG